MRSHWIVAAILAVFPAASSFAQQSPLDMRKQVEQMTATFSERYNKQDAAALATMFVKDAVRVSSADGAASTGPQAIAESFKTQFKLGFNHIDLIVDQVSPLGTDAAVTTGRYQTTGRGQDGLLRVEGHWTQVEVREAGAWKIRLLTVAPKTEPNAATARPDAVAMSVPRAEPAAASVARPEGCCSECAAPRGRRCERLACRAFCCERRAHRCRGRERPAPRGRCCECPAPRGCCYERLACRARRCERRAHRCRGRERPAPRGRCCECPAHGGCCYERPAQGSRGSERRARRGRSCEPPAHRGRCHQRRT